MPALRSSYRVLHAANVTPDLLKSIRALLDLAFDGGFSDNDWDHSLGGIHVVARQGDAIIGHAAVVQRRLVIGVKAFRAGYVEALAVHPAWRRRGIAWQTMARVERIIRRAYALGALAATDQSLHLYERRGWVRWRGPLAALTPNGVASTPDEEVHVLVGEIDLDLDAAMICDWRDGDVW